MQRPIIEHYSDYADYLQSMYTYLKAQPQGCSYRGLAEKTGMGSHGYLRMVIHGDRKLKPDHIETLGKALLLSDGEIGFLRHLVQARDSQAVEDRSRALMAMSRRAAFREHFHIDRESLAFVSSWHVTAILELVAVPGFRPDPKWIVDYFGPRLTQQHARAALDVLQNLGMIEQAEDGRVHKVVGSVKTADEFRSELGTAYHLEAAKLGVWSAETHQPEQRNFGVVTARIDQAKLPEVMAEVHRLRHQLVDYLTELESDTAETIIQVNLQAFPLKNLEKEELE